MVRDLGNIHTQGHGSLGEDEAFGNLTQLQCQFHVMSDARVSGLLQFLVVATPSFVPAASWTERSHNCFDGG